jgi:hypothetical protein
VLFFFLFLLLPLFTANRAPTTGSSSNFPQNTDNVNLTEYKNVICICRKEYDEEKDDVIGCDDENCPFKWLHFKCVGIRKIPKSLVHDLQ